jgi:ParB/RepB/Spo0J family partition protein
MNAPATPAALTAEAFKLLALAELAPSTTRTQERRRSRFTSKEIAELADNIKAMGIMLPIIVRPHPRPPNAVVKFEIVAGERRWLAADKAGLITAPVIVREIADADLVQFQLTENLQRKTIDQLEEAEGYDELRKLKKITADQVADLLGTSRTTVFNRLKLLDLCPEARKALEEGRLSQSNAMLIARIGHHDTQRKVLVEAIGPAGRPYPPDETMTYRDLQYRIADRYMLDLKSAPFKLDDETLLPKAGSCAKCPKRTGNQKDLFADVKNANVCTDPKCYDDKRQIVFHKAAAELEAKGRKVIAGIQARKIMPYAAENGSDNVGGGYTKLTERQYGSGSNGRTAAQILGPEFKPTLLQHPGTGKFIEVATNQAITAAQSGKKPKTDKGLKVGLVKAKHSARRLELPDLDDQVIERLIRIIAEKAPTKFNRGVLVSLVKVVYPEINARSDHLELIAKHYGWPRTAFRSGGYVSRTKLPKEAAKFDEPKLVLLLLYTVFAAHWGPHGNPSVTDFLGINTNKVRETIIAERKQAQANARMKAKLTKESPLVKTKTKATKKKKAGKK